MAQRGSHEQAHFFGELRRRPPDVIADDDDFRVAAGSLHAARVFERVLPDAIEHDAHPAFRPVPDNRHSLKVWYSPLAMRWLLATVLFLSIPLACETPAPKTALSYTADAKRAYEEAVTEFKAHNWIESQALFREVKRKYSYSRYARLAELRIADADFEQDKYAEALREYKAFIHDHRSEIEEVAYARARAAEAQYREISESFLLAPSEQRDQAATLAAYKELADFLKDYPDAAESPRICALLEDVTAKLVRHELYVAQFYLRKDNFEAAVLRAQYAIRSYGTEVRCPSPRAVVKDKAKDADEMPVLEVPESKPENAFGLIPDALLLLGETYLKMRRPAEARAAFEAILARYPQSGLVVQAKNYLKASG